MGWEARGRGGTRVYYRVYRDGGRVRREYLGRGALAGEAAAAVDARRQHAEAGRRAVRDALAGLAAADALLREVGAAAAVLMDATLHAAGWHRPNHGRWRMRRDGEQ